MTADSRRIPSVAVIGHKNSGKTTLVERLVVAFTRAGMRVASIRHTSDEIGFDKPRSDSDRHKRAGAVAVGLVAKSEIGFYLDHTPQTSEAWIETVLAGLPSPPDLILYEGYRGGPHPKIECIRDPNVSMPSFSASEGLIAVVSDHHIETDVPVLSPESIEPVCRVIRDSLGRHDWPETRGKLH
ncbi:MAG TPA: molybdopterin-guanine dinucleotide biosynthesis protein B [Acidobacteriota bacterium]|nr:molybdopterin-guanine dinucleotide biosynthesis protein B [Acidobacteriota bacterium]